MKDEKQEERPMRKSSKSIVNADRAAIRQALTILEDGNDNGNGNGNGNNISNNKKQKQKQLKQEGNNNKGVVDNENVNDNKGERKQQQQQRQPQPQRKQKQRQKQKQKQKQLKQQRNNKEIDNVNETSNSNSNRNRYRNRNSNSNSNSNSNTIKKHNAKQLTQGGTLNGGTKNSDSNRDNINSNSRKIQKQKQKQLNQTSNNKVHVGDNRNRNDNDNDSDHNNDSSNNSNSNIINKIDNDNQNDNNNDNNVGTNNNNTKKRNRNKKKYNAKFPWRRHIQKGTVDPITLEDLRTLPYPPFALSVDEPYVSIPEWPILKTPLSMINTSIVTSDGDDDGKTHSARPLHLFDGFALATYMVSQLQFFDPYNRRALTRPELVNLDRYLNRHSDSGRDGFNNNEDGSSKPKQIRVSDAYDSINQSSVGATVQSRSDIMQQTAQQQILDSLFYEEGVIGGRGFIISDDNNDDNDGNENPGLLGGCNFPSLSAATSRNRGVPNSSFFYSESHIAGHYGSRPLATAATAFPWLESAVGSSNNTSSSFWQTTATLTTTLEILHQKAKSRT